MSASSPHNDFGILQQIFADMANNVKYDEIQHLLVLTYEFDDQQLLNLLSGRRLADNLELQRNQLKFIADMRPVVIYDARKTRDFNQLPHFLDLLPVNSGAYRCHHAKGYLFVTKKSVRLVLGSFNLTRTGLFQNREVFIDFAWSDKQTVDIAILKDFTRLLEDGYEQWAQPASSAARNAIVATLKERIAHWDNEAVTSSRYLLPSGYKNFKSAQGLNLLAEIWNSISDTAPQKVLAVSPFFDKGEICFADNLANAVGAPNQIQIVTDDANILKLGKCHFGAKHAGQIRTLNLIPALINEQEKTRIANSNDGARLDGLEISRALHAKILVLCNGEKHLVYMGSANFTVKAWNEDNQELGIVEIHKGNAEKLFKSILESLGAEQVNAYDRLKEFATDTEATDDEDYISQIGYPDFLNGIRLEGAPDGAGLLFHFFCESSADLAKYDIHWGHTKLVINGYQSQHIPRDQAYMPLRGGRNLSFVPHEAPTQTYLLPFIHDAALVQQQDLMLFPSAEDWLEYYLNPNHLFGLGTDEWLPGDDQDKEAPIGGGEDTVDRDANIVIAMQRYLNLFSRVEAEFQHRAKAIVKETFDNETTRTRAIEQKIIEPLRVYFRLLEQDHKRKPSQANDDVFLFRLGELLLMCIALAVILPQLNSLTDVLAKELDPLRTSASAVQRTYIDFVKKQITQ